MRRRRPAARARTRRQVSCRSCRKRLAETERHRGARVVVGQLRIFRDVLAHRVGHLLRPDVGRQAEILADPRPRRAADRIDGVVDAVGGAFDVGRARRPRFDVRLRAQPVEISARESRRRQRHGKRRGTKHCAQHGVPYVNAARGRLLPGRRGAGTPCSGRKPAGRAPSAAPKTVILHSFAPLPASMPRCGSSACSGSRSRPARCSASRIRAR